MKKCIVLLSGGLDSTTCLAIAKDSGYECYAMSFDYGQKHKAELVAAENISLASDVKKHEIVKLSIGNLGGSSLTDDQNPIPDFSADGKIPTTYVPARNTVFLSIALGWAEIIEAEAIFIGISSIDYSGYPDCRPEFVEAFQKLAHVATAAGVAGKRINIKAPLIKLSKADTIILGQSLGVDYSKTISCYRANNHGEACGKCDSCGLRKQGFADAGLEDTTTYA